MARSETVLSVFLASPGDVADARKQLERVVDELNFTWSREYRLRLELVKWETHCSSGIGDDPQDVINQQLDQFDIFLGIMWKRFGEPTKRAESGTQEEFQRARQRYEQDPNSIRIMFYFKDAPPERLSEVNPKQLEAVKAFREDVSQAGVFYKIYSTTHEFERLVRRDLSRQIQEWGKTWGGILDELERPLTSSDDNDRGAGRVPTASPQATVRSITAIVFEEMECVERLERRLQYDPEVMHRAFREAQAILDSSLEKDDWGHLAAQQAAALVTVALASRLQESAPAHEYLARVCNRVLSLQGLQIHWDNEKRDALFKVAAAAKERHDDDVLVWIKRHSIE